MKLRKLELHGFKSFADRVDFVFEDGVTGVVGPNGCGKSNLVDAVRWVLGEQSAKSLRGQQMMDVIFNGSSSRKPQGLAEVSLTFDNSDRVLPIDSDTTVVTRKLYRDGESEYLLNGNSCRLRDVRDLFLDTGLGHDSYSVIEQGKVDLLVQSSSLERRAIFDEAAGIAKYKARRKEATRKLERAEQDLLRVSDIIEEVQKRLRSVKLQAGKARNFQEYDHRLRQLRISGALAEFDKFTRERSSISQTQGQIEDQNTALSSQLNQISAEKLQLSLELAEFDRQITAADNQLVQNQAHIGSARDHIEFARGRVIESQEDLDHQRRRAAQVKAQAGELRTRIERQEALTSECRQKEEQLQVELSQIQQQHVTAGQQTIRLAADLEDEKSGVMDLVRRTSQLHNEISGQDRFRQTLSAQRDRISHEASALDSQLEDLLIRKAQLEEKDQQIAGLLSQDQQAWDRCRGEAAQTEVELGQLQERLAQVKETRSAVQSQQSLLRDMEARLDGINQGVRQILEGKSNGQFEYVIGIIANLLEADLEHAALIEAALAGAEQFLVVQDSCQLSADLARISKLSGRATFLCLDLIPPFVDGYDWSQHDDYIARAVEYVRFDAPLGPAAWHLLGRTIVVRDLAAALQLSRLAPAGYRYVTPQGQLLESDGLLRLGQVCGTSGVMLRHSQLRELSIRLPQLESEITDLTDELQSRQAQFDHLHQTQQKLRTAIYEANVAQAQNSSHVQQNTQAITRLSKDKPRLAEEISQLEEEIAHAMAVRDDSRNELDELEQISQHRNERISKLTAQHSQALAAQQALADKVADLRVAVTRAHEQFAAAEAEQDHIQRDIQHNHQESESVHQDIQSALRRITEAEHTVLNTEARLAELFADRELIQRECAERHHQRDQLSRKVEALNNQERELTTAQSELLENLHQAQLKLNEVTVRLETLIQRVREEFSLSLEEEYRSYQPEDLDLEEVAREVEDLRGKIRRLGNINLDAITEQEELEARLAFLQGQNNDIVKSKNQLEDLIRQINRESRELFLSSFEVIRQRFGEFFRKLFGGGRADILLSDPDDPLECGIEIIARPPGKELQSISLFSGGEKTMAAVALLFAIFRSKISPLCILDEVDAALDEANNERFNALVQEFLADSQFIIITHAKRSIADVLYGVTMQEPGVSKRVSVKFEDQSVSAVA
ncbi:MAG: chromosome segregation protein SMC [Actinobacteria bacterium]|nr:chromosome segregation protein SMC [Actinomycetota bacterium]